MINYFPKGREPTHNEFTSPLINLIDLDRVDIFEKKVTSLGAKHKEVTKEKGYTPLLHAAAAGKASFVKVRGEVVCVCFDAGSKFFFIFFPFVFALFMGRLPLSDAPDPGGEGLQHHGREGQRRPQRHPPGRTLRPTRLPQVRPAGFVCAFSVLVSVFFFAMVDDFFLFLSFFFFLSSAHSCA
jgi:hypothetical protein